MYKYVSLKSGVIPLLFSVVVVISVNPVRIPGLFVSPDRAGLLRSKLPINSTIYFLPLSSLQE